MCVNPEVERELIFYLSKSIIILMVSYLNIIKVAQKTVFISLLTEGGAVCLLCNVINGIVFTSKFK